MFILKTNISYMLSCFPATRMASAFLHQKKLNILLYNKCICLPFVVKAVVAATAAARQVAARAYLRLEKDAIFFSSSRK